jgi:hypothetical protein
VLEATGAFELDGLTSPESAGGAVGTGVGGSARSTGAGRSAARVAIQRATATAHA